MVIKFVKPTTIAGYGYFEGSKLNCDDKFGQKAIDLGFAEKISNSNDGQEINIAPLLDFERNQKNFKANKG